MKENKTIKPIDNSESIDITYATYGSYSYLIALTEKGMMAKSVAIQMYGAEEIDEKDLKMIITALLKSGLTIKHFDKNMTISQRLNFLYGKDAFEENEL